MRLHQAAGQGDIRAVQRLLTGWRSFFNKVNKKDGDGDTPLHFAAAFGRRDVVELLLTRGGDVNARNNACQTPLAVALGCSEQGEKAAKLPLSLLMFMHGQTGTFERYGMQFMPEPDYQRTIELLKSHGGTE